MTAGRTDTLRAARESITLLRNQNNALPLSPTSKIVVTGSNANSMTYQVGGWSVSWQGPYTSGHVCCEGPPGQIPPGTTVLKGLKGEDCNVTYAPDQASAVAMPRRRTPWSSPSARRHTPRAWGTTPRRSSRRARRAWSAPWRRPASR